MNQYTQYKINVPIVVQYISANREESITDLTLTPTNPSGSDQTPITFTEIGDGLYKASFTPNATGWWIVRVTSITKPKNSTGASYFVGTEFTTYPPQEDGKLNSIDTKLGEVQTNPTANTLLGRLKDIYDKLVSGILVDKTKIWDGSHTIQAISDANGNYNLGTSFIQNALTSTGNSSTANLNSGATFVGTTTSAFGINAIQIIFKADQNCSLYVEQSSDNGSNWDISDTISAYAGIGVARTITSIAPYFRVRVTNNGAVATTYLRLATGMTPVLEVLPRTLTPSGNLRVELAPKSSSHTLQLSYDNNTSTPINTGEWQDAVTYIIPATYDFSPSLFCGYSAQALDQARVVSVITVGSYNTSTNTFTDGNSTTLPNFYAKMYCQVTSVIGGVGDDIITITYTNQAGTTGQTATATIKKNSLVGTKVEVTLATGDYGIIDITNVTHTRTGQAGAFDILADKEINFMVLTTANILYEQKADSGTIYFPESTIIKVQYLTAQAGAKSRKLSLVGVLTPRS